MKPLKRRLRAAVAYELASAFRFQAPQRRSEAASPLPAREGCASEGDGATIHALSPSSPASFPEKDPDT